MTDRLPLPFGGGLDRATGATKVDPSRFSDLRNVRLFDGKLAARLGQLLRESFSGEGGHATTHVIGIISARTAGVGVVITYDSGAQTCHAWRMNGTSTPTYLDNFWTIGGAAADPPKVKLAASYGLVFVAHDEVDFTSRQVTQVIDVGAGTVSDLTTPELGNVKFRGVKDWLAYLVGWGHGTVGDPDHPEIVRVSLGGAPTSFDVNHYWVAGQATDPVLACEWAGQNLLVLKEAVNYIITGTDRSNWRILPNDYYYGVAGSALAVTVGGVCYFWSVDGPRRSVGGVSDDLGVLLDLATPVGMLDETLDHFRGFACYAPQQREVWFCFGKWVYVLHLAEPALKWSYHEFPTALITGGILYDTTSTLGPECIAVADDPQTDFDPDDPNSWVFKGDVTGTVHGDELVEYWVHASSGDALTFDPSEADWELVFTGPVILGAFFGYFLALTYSKTFYANSAYEAAARIKRNGLYGTGYLGDDPSLWTATARATVVFNP